MDKSSSRTVESPWILAIPLIDNLTFFGSDKTVKSYLKAEDSSAFSTSSMAASTSYLVMVVTVGSFLLIEIEFKSTLISNLNNHD